MKLLQETISKIPAVDTNAIEIVRQKLHHSCPEADALGLLPTLLYKYVGITGDPKPSLPKKRMIIACADHGVAVMGTSAYPIETTVHMTKNYLISHGAVANAMANFTAADMTVVDMGIAAPLDDVPGLINKKIAHGTKNCAMGAAMSRNEAIAAIHTGIALAAAYSEQGYRCFLPGEMGIANTTASAAIVAVCCGLTPEQATGRGTNISDERLKLKIDVVRQTLAVNKPNPQDGIDILAKVGGFELGCITGIILGAAAHRSFVVLDGFNTSAAALIAAAICPAVKPYLMGSHLAAEPAHKQALAKLELRPYIDMQFRLGEATGSSIAVNLLDAAITVYNELTAETKPCCMRHRLNAAAAALAPAELSQYTANITPPKQSLLEECQFYIDNLTKPIHSLGLLEGIAVKIAGIRETVKPPHQAKALLVHGKSNDLHTAFARHTGAALAALPDLPPDIGCYAAVARGIHAGEQLLQAEAAIIGFADASPTAAKAAAELAAQIDAEPSPEKLFSEQNAELAYLAGVMLAAAKHRAAVVTDGIASQAAAYIAIRLAPAAADCIIIPEYAHPALAAAIGLPAYMKLQAAAGQGLTGAIGLKLVDAALHMVNDMKTFQAAAVATATDGPGSTRQVR